MQSEIDSPCRLNFSSRCRVSASIGICQLPFDKRRSGCRNGAGAPTIRMRMRHSSVISISGITYGSQDGSPRILTRAGCWPHESAPIARSGRMSQLNRGNAGIRPANRLARLDRGGEHDVGRESGMRTKSDIPPVLMLDNLLPYDAGHRVVGSPSSRSTRSRHHHPRNGLWTFDSGPGGRWTDRDPRQCSHLVCR